MKLGALGVGLRELMTRRSQWLHHVLHPFQPVFLAQCLTHYKCSVNIYGISWMSCCLPSESEQVFSEVPFNKWKVEEKEPSEEAHSHWIFARRMQKESTKLCWHEKCHLSRSPHSSTCTFLTLAGNSCWASGVHLFPSIWPWGNERRCPHSWEIPPTSLPGMDSPPAFQRPPTLTSLSGDNCQYASQKAQIAAAQIIVSSLWYLPVAQPLGKCPSPCTVFASHAPKHPE